MSTVKLSKSEKQPSGNEVILANLFRRNNIRKIEAFKSLCVIEYRLRRKLVHLDGCDSRLEIIVNQNRQNI